MASIELRAKRTHARRSCDLCKVRKTRCELPDLDIPSSSDPLPTDKSCHRCRVLALPCVVDDSGLRWRKKKEIAGVGGGLAEDGVEGGVTGTAKVSKSGVAEVDATSGGQRGKKKRKSSIMVNTDQDAEDMNDKVDKDVTSGEGQRKGQRTPNGKSNSGARAKQKNVTEPPNKTNHSLDLFHGFSPLQPHIMTGASSGLIRDYDKNYHQEESTSNFLSSSQSHRPMSTRIYNTTEKSGRSGLLNPSDTSDSILNPNRILFNDGKLAPRNIDKNTSGEAAGMDEVNPSVDRAQSIRLHGRPLELVSAMLGVAYGKLGMRIQRREVVGDDIDLGELVDQIMRTRLEHGYSQLRSYHPHLQSMSRLFSMYADTPTPPIALLLSTTLYLSSLSLPLDQPVMHLRSVLTAIISHFRHLILIQLPQSVYSLQAIEILALHAPLGPLPFQLTELRELAPARGYVAAIQNIMEATRFHDIMKMFLSRMETHDLWENEDVWLWYGIRATEAQTALEDEKVRKPIHLADARASSSAFLSKEYENRWSVASWGGVFESSELLGRLTVCDRLARLDEVHDALIRLRGAIDTAATTPNFDVVKAITAEYEKFHSNMEQIDRRHDDILSMLSFPRALTSAWTSYRAIRRRFELCKVYVLGLHIFMSVHFLPGNALSFPGLPTNLAPSQAVQYAFSRSYNPPDMIAVITSTTPAADELKRWGRKRGEIAEQVLVAFAELQHTILPGQRGSMNVFRADIIPLHEVLAVAVECAKVLMEMQAGSVIALKSIKALHKAFRIPTWLYTMRQVCEVMHSLGSLCIDDGKGGESVSNGCSNLVGSMVRTADEWGKMVDRESSTSSSVSSNSGGSVSPNGIPAHVRHSDREAYLKGLGAVPSPPPNPPNSLPPATGHQHANIGAGGGSNWNIGGLDSAIASNGSGEGCERDPTSISVGASGSRGSELGNERGRSEPNLESGSRTIVLNEMGLGSTYQNQYMSGSDRWLANTTAHINDITNSNKSGEESGSQNDHAEQGQHQTQRQSYQHIVHPGIAPNYYGHMENGRGCGSGGHDPENHGYPNSTAQQQGNRETGIGAPINHQHSNLGNDRRSNDEQHHQSGPNHSLFDTHQQIVDHGPPLHHAGPNVLGPIPSSDGMVYNTQTFPRIAYSAHFAQNTQIPSDQRATGNPLPQPPSTQSHSPHLPQSQSHQEPSLANIRVDQYPRSHPHPQHHHPHPHPSHSHPHNRLDPDTPPHTAQFSIYPMPPQRMPPGPVPSQALPRTPPGVPTMTAGLGINRNAGPEILPNNSGDNVPVSIASDYGGGNAFDALMAEMFGYGSGSRILNSNDNSGEPMNQSQSGSGDLNNNNHSVTDRNEEKTPFVHAFGSRNYIHPDQRMDASWPSHPDQIHAQAQAHFRAQQLAAHEHPRVPGGPV